MRYLTHFLFVLSANEWSKMMLTFTTTFIHYRLTRNTMKCWKKHGICFEGVRMWPCEKCGGNRVMSWPLGGVQNNITSITHFSLGCFTVTTNDGKHVYFVVSHFNTMVNPWLEWRHFFIVHHVCGLGEDRNCRYVCVGSLKHIVARVLLCFCECVCDVM